MKAFLCSRRHPVLIQDGGPAHETDCLLEGENDSLSLDDEKDFFLSQKANSNLIGDKGSFTNYREGGEEGEGEGVGGNGHTKCGRRSRR